MNKLYTDEIQSLEEEVKNFKPEITKGVRSCDIKNRMPPRYKVVIQIGGVKFQYLSGGSYQDGPRDINLYSGHDETFYSNDTGECCEAMICVVYVTSPYLSGGGQTMQGVIGRKDPTTCLVSGEFTIALKDSVTEEELKTGDLSQLIEFGPTIVGNG